jgi:hypothetical protein
MKLDLIEIQKLSPPGLWDLRVLSDFIACLLRVMDAGIGARLAYGSMVLKFSQELRDKTHDNLNMKIKAWVLQCPVRIDHVRRLIGEAAMRRWRQNRLLDYALTKTFGDWQTKFSNGFARKANKQRRSSTSTIIRKMRPYNWQPFALLKIKNVYGFLYGRPVFDPDLEDQRAAHLKLWGVDILDAGTAHKCQQPRTKRSLKPVEFTPYELMSEKCEEVAENIIEAVRVRPATIEISPAETAKPKALAPTLEQPP